MAEGRVGDDRETLARVGDGGLERHFCGGGGCVGSNVGRNIGSLLCAWDYIDGRGVWRRKRRTRKDDGLNLEKKMGPAGARSLNT